MRLIRNILVLIVAFLVLFPDTGIASSLRVTWNANSDSDLTGYKVYYGTQSNTYGTPVSIVGAVSYDIPNVQAGSTYYVAVSAYDSSNNESVKSTEQSAYIPVSDTTPPTGSVSINSAAASTTSTAVTLTLSASDAAGTVTGMKFSNDGTTYSSEVAYATSYSWTLSTGYGTKTVYVLFKDSSGNWMTSPATDTISYVDTTAPTGSIVINSGATSTSSTTVTLTLSATDNSGSVTGMKFSNDGTTYSSEYTYATSYSWALSSSTGTKTVYAKFKDSAGNWSSAFSDTIQLTDTTAPTGSVVINSGASSTTSTTVTLALSATDSSGTVTGMKFSNDGTTYSSEVTYASTYSWPVTSSLGTKTVYAMFKDNSGNWSSAVSDTIQLVSSSPVAEAGSNQNVVPQRVILDGTASYDPSGQTLTYSWSQVSGTTVIIETSTASTASFLGITAGTYQFRLTCSNGTSSSSDTVSVTIQNVAPTVDAGSNRTILAGTAITLHATGQDSNENTLTYQWTKVSGSSVTLPSLAQQDITFTPTIAGQYTFSVVCSDGTNTSAASQVIVTVNAVNTAPTANAGVDQDVTVGSTVTLAGSGSTDPDGNTLTYAWSQTSGTSVTLSSTTAANPTFTASTVGTRVFRLVVNDGYVSSTADTVTIRVLSQNTPPVANAGSDVHAYVGDDVVLNASGSYDSDLDGLTYVWSQVSGATVAIFNANTISAFFTPTTSGTYEFKVTISDGQATSTDKVIVTVDNANQVPIANAGSSITATVGSTVTLDGSASYDPDASTISYIWSQTSGTQVSLSNSNTASPSFVAGQAGVYVFELKVYDGTDTSSASSVTVTVQSSANQITLVSPVSATVCYSSPTLKWAGSGFKSYKAYMSINSGKTYSKIYSGSNTSTTLHAVLWQWFITSGTTVTWYVEGTTSSGTTVKSSTSTFKKK
jgi:large repetitive protein